MTTPKQTTKVVGKKPLPKGATKNRHAAVAKKSQIVQRKAMSRGKLLRGGVIALSLLVLAGVAFGLYASLAYGGVRQYRQAHQSFPGAQAPVVAAGRQNVLSQLNSISNQVKTLPGATIITTASLVSVDQCVKGQHDGILGLAHDNYAYWCSRFQLSSILRRARFPVSWRRP